MVDELGSPPPPKLAVQISSNHPFDTGEISWVTTVPQDIEPDQLDAVLNKLREAVFTQHKWHQIFRMENEIEHALRQIAQLNTNINMVDHNYPNQERAPVDARTARKQAVDSILRQEDLINVLRGEIEQVRHQLNGG